MMTPKYNFASILFFFKQHKKLVNVFPIFAS